MFDQPKKDLHIVFKTLNFIYGDASLPYQLSADEKLMLIALARHQGPRGIYPSLATVSRELKRDHRNVRRTIERLEKKHLLSVLRANGRHSDYFLDIPDLSTTQGVHAPSGVHATQGAGAPPPRASTPYTQGVHAPQSIQIINTEEEREALSVQKMHKSKKPGLGRIPHDWAPDAERSRMAGERGDAAILTRKFVNLAKSRAMESADWNAAFENFLLNERPPATARAVTSAGITEIRSTVPEWGPGHPAWEELQRYRKPSIDQGGSGNDNAQHGHQGNGIAQPARPAHPAGGAWQRAVASHTPAGVGQPRAAAGYCDGILSRTYHGRAAG